MPHSTHLQTIVYNNISRLNLFLRFMVDAVAIDFADAPADADGDAYADESVTSSNLHY